MLQSISSILTDHKLPDLTKKGICIAQVQSETKGFALAQDILYSVIDRHTLLLLSGGRTPKQLYKQLAEDHMLNPGAVGMVDERYGNPHHESSNELMLEQSGLLTYLREADVPFYPVIQSEQSRQHAALSYARVLTRLYREFSKKIGILGIGLDGHTAGIPSQSEVQFSDQNVLEFEKSDLIVAYNSEKESYGERITMTYTALATLDFYLVLVFGEDKADALQKVFSEGSERDIPARFYTRPAIADKTLIITDRVL